MTIPVIELNGTFTDAAGDPMTGTLSFRLNHALYDATGNVVSERVEIVSTLDAQGRITDTDGTTVGLTLFCTSGDDITPAGLVYDVAVNVGSRPHKVSVALPDTLGATVDWADLVPVPASTGVVWTVPDLTEEQARDLVGTTLVEGAGIDITVDDNANTVTIAAEVTQAELDAEATARANADSAEATARANADTALDARLDAIEGLGPLATDAEVTAAIAALSGTYAPLGLAVPQRLLTPKRAEHTIVSDMSSGWTIDGAAGSSGVTNDTSDFALGTQSARITSAGTGSAGVARASRYGMSLDMTAKKFRLWLKVSNIDNLGEMYVYMRSGGSWANYQAVVLHDGDLTRRHFQGDEWFVTDVPWSRIALSGGTLNRAAVEGIRIGVWDKGGGGTVTVRVGGLATVADQTIYPNGVVSMTYDDGYVGQYTKAAPQLSAVGMRGTAYVIQELIGAGGTTMTLDQLKALQNVHGWEVGGHAKTSAAHDNRLTSLTTSELRAELRDHAAWLRENGLSGTSYAYPGGVWSLAIESEVNRLWPGGRTTFTATLEVVPPVQRLRMKSYVVADTTPVATLTGLIDAAKANKEWLILCFHRIEDATTTSISYSTANHQLVVNHLVSSGVAVRTVEDVFRATAYGV